MGVAMDGQEVLTITTNGEDSVREVYTAPSYRYFAFETSGLMFRSGNIGDEDDYSELDEDDWY